MRPTLALLAAAALVACGQTASPSAPAPVPTTPAAPSGPDAVIQPVGAPVPIPPPPEPDAFGRGLDALCRVSREVKSDATIPPSDKPLRIAERFRAASPDPAVLRFLGSLSGMTPEHRYPAMLAEAVRHGLGPSWTCQELADPNP